MKASVLAVLSAVWCVLLALREDDAMPSWFLWGDLSADISSWCLSIAICLLVSHFWRDGMRLWILPLVGALILVNPVQELFDGSSEQIKGYLAAAFVLICYVPTVRNFAGKLVK